MIKIIIAPSLPDPITLEINKDPNFNLFDIFKYDDKEFEVREIEERELITEDEELVWKPKTYIVFYTPEFTPLIS